MEVEQAELLVFEVLDCFVEVTVVVVVVFFLCVSASGKAVAEAARRARSTAFISKVVCVLKG